MSSPNYGYNLRYFQHLAVILPYNKRQTIFEAVEKTSLQKNYVVFILVRLYGIRR